MDLTNETPDAMCDFFSSSQECREISSGTGRCLQVTDQADVEAVSDFALPGR